MGENEQGYRFEKIEKEEAVRLLRSSELPVDVVAESVGLSGKTNFYEKFRQFYGMTPAELRRQR